MAHGGRRAAMVLLLVASACSQKPTPAVTSPPSPSPTRTPRPPVTFHAYNVRLDPGAEQGSDEIRFDFEKAGKAEISITGPAVDICPVPDISQSAQTSETCTHGTSASFPEDAVAIRTKDSPVTLEEIRLTMTPVEVAVKVLLPLVVPKPGASACKDNGCNPFFELTPRRGGKVSAIATWDGIATGRLSILEGGLAEHAYTQTGTDYKVLAVQDASSDRGPPHMSVSASVSEAEVGVVLSNEGARPLLSPQVSISWP